MEIRGNGNVVRNGTVGEAPRPDTALMAVYRRSESLNHSLRSVVRRLQAHRERLIVTKVGDGSPDVDAVPDPGSGAINVLRGELDLAFQSVDEINRILDELEGLV